MDNQNYNDNDNFTMNHTNDDINSNSNQMNTQINKQENLSKNSNKLKTGFKKNNFLTSAFVIIVLAVAVFVTGVGIFLYQKFSNGTSSKSLSSSINLNQPIKVKKGDKYGYINTNGKFVIDPVFNSASDFNGNYAIVEGTTNIDGVETSMYQLIDTKGNVKLSSKYSSDFKYIAAYNIWIIDDVLYNSSLKKLSGDGVEVRYEDYGYLTWENSSKRIGGIMTSTGKITYSYKFADDEDFISIDPSTNLDSLEETYCKVNVNKKNAIVNCDTGKVVYDYTDKFISDEDNNIFEISEKDSYQFISILYIQNDKIAYQSDSDQVSVYYSPKCYVEIRDNRKDYRDRYSYYDTVTNQVVKENPSVPSSCLASDISEWEEFTGLREFKCDSGRGLMKGENVILPCEWSAINYFRLPSYQLLKSDGKDYVITKRDDKTYLVNLKNGKTVAEFNTTYIYDDNRAVSNIDNNKLSTFIYYIDKDTDKKVVYSLLTGNTIEMNKNNSLSTYSNYITIKENNKLNYYNNNLKLIYTEEK